MSEYLIHLIAISIVFFISSFLVYGNLSFDKGDLNIEDESYNIISNLNKIDEIVESKNTTEIFFSFYTQENRLYSTMLQQIKITDMADIFQCN